MNVVVSKKTLKLTSRKVCAGFDLTNFVSQSRLMNFMLAKEIGFQVLSSLTLYICIRSYNLISERLLDIKCLFVAISWSNLHAHPKVWTSIKLNDQVFVPCNIRIRSYDFIVVMMVGRPIVMWLIALNCIDYILVNKVEMSHFGKIPLS